MKSLGLPLALSLACTSPQDTAISEWVDLGNGLMPGSSSESEEEQFEPREETLITVNIRDTAEAVDTAVPEEEEEAVLYSEIDLESCFADYKEYGEVDPDMYCVFNRDFATLSDEGIFSVGLDCEISFALEERPLIFSRIRVLGEESYQLLSDLDFDFIYSHVSTSVELDIYAATGASSKPEMNGFVFEVYLMKPDCRWVYLEEMDAHYEWLDDEFLWY